MASYLHYQIWRQIGLDGRSDGRLVALERSGTITLSGSMSAAVPVPDGDGASNMAGIFQVYGSDLAYIHIRGPKDGAPAGASAHASLDSQARMLLSAADGPRRVPLPSGGGQFGAVQAAALT